VPPEDAGVRETARPRGFDVIHFAHLEYLAAHEPRDSGPAGDADHDHDVVDRGRQEGKHGQDQEEQGEADHDLDQTRNHHIRCTAKIAREAPQGDADDGGDAHRDDADRQRDPRAVDDAREDVIAQIVGAEDMPFFAGRQQHLFQPDLGRVKGYGRHDDRVVFFPRDPCPPLHAFRDFRREIAGAEYREI